jgi:hypothetical protein
MVEADNDARHTTDTRMTPPPRTAHHHLRDNRRRRRAIIATTMHARRNTTTTRRPPALEYADETRADVLIRGQEELYDARCARS